MPEFIAELYLSRADAGGAQIAAYEAAAAETVGEAGRLAGLDFERIVLAVEAR